MITATGSAPVRCGLVKAAADDPIVFPNQPGASHFFNGWDPATLQGLVDRCLQTVVDCGHVRGTTPAPV